MSILFTTVFGTNKNTQNFWKYNFLNSVIKKEEAEIILYQKKRIETYLTGSIDILAQNTNLNRLLKEPLGSGDDGITSTIENQIIQNLLLAIDDLQKEGSGGSKKWKRNDQKGQQLLNTYKNKLNELTLWLKTIKYQDFITKEEINKINNIIELTKNFNTMSDINIQKSAKIASQIKGNLSILKGSIIENEGVAWINSKIPSNINIEAINTSSVANKGRKILSDILIMDMSIPDLDQLKITYRLAGIEYGPITLREFLTKIKTHTDSTSLSIQDGYENLINSSIASIQSKSGVKQRPFNQNKTNQVSFYELSTAHYFKALLNCANWASQHGWKTINLDNDITRSLFNYGLASVIPRIMNFDTNKYILTRNGIQHYLTYFKQEMLQKNTRYFQLSKYCTLKSAMNFGANKFTIDF